MLVLHTDGPEVLGHIGKVNYGGEYDCMRPDVALSTVTRRGSGWVSGCYTCFHY